MRKALVVGINDYRTAPLRGCINDATEFKAIIERNGDGSPNFDIHFAKDVKSKAQLLGMIRDIFSGNSAIEISLFYFSGHGYINDLGGYIVTPDAQQNDEGVSMDDILTIANNSEVRNKIIILDCCHSGAMGSPSITGGKAAQITSGVTILTASMSNQQAIEINGHGIFTNLLLDALRGGAANLQGNITAGSVYAYIDQALGPFHQRPVFKTNVINFCSLRNITPQVPMEILRKLAEYFPTGSHEFSLDPEFEYTQPNATQSKIAIFKHLQKFESVGLVLPVGEEHMYWAAINGKSCKLTALGYHYWRLIKDGRV